MTTIKPIKYNPAETSNFPHKFPFVIQGLAEAWQDSKYGTITVKGAIRLAKTLDICMTENTELRIVKSC